MITTTIPIWLSDLLDPRDLEEMVADKFVREQVHPTMPLKIYNYTEKATFEREWNDVTLMCRGLIVNYITSEVVARPFPKFFNYGEHDADELDLSARVTITDKLDGSLGIPYPSPMHRSGWAIATRGSFTSEQALHATQRLNASYADWAPPTGMTVLFEVVYPQNRIVVDYQGLDDLILLGAVDIATGASYSPLRILNWTGPYAQVFAGKTLADALAIPPRPGKEGVVVRFHHNDMRVKIKQDDYVQLHRLITGMNARVVWERIGAGDTLDQICEGIPEEFWPWVQEVGSELIREAGQIMDDTMIDYIRSMLSMPLEFTRKDFALEASKSPFRAYLFMLFDDRSPAEAIWKTLRPSAERALFNRSEDVS